jgi:hypothetical protein
VLYKEKNMSEVNSTSGVVLSDDAFKAYAKNIKETEAKRSQGGNFAPPEYDDIQYCGMEKGLNKIVRLLGAPVGIQGYVSKDTDPVELQIADVKDDDGKRMVLKLPVRADQAANDHIVHRLYDKVCEVTWIKNPATGKREKKFVNEAKYPELFEAVTKTGFKQDKDGKSYSYANGLKGQQVVVYNLIDRSDTWCADNKHTKVLSKQVDVVAQDDGSTRTFAKIGVPSFGFINKLADQIGKYGNYENYDLAIKKTGEKTSPYEVRNASKLKSADLLDELLNDTGDEVDVASISVGPLTKEELAYERYDLKKLYQPTSYQSLRKRLSSVFKLCDATTGSKFYDELDSLANDERARYDAINAAKAETQETTENAAIKDAVKEEERAEEPKTESKPAATRAPVEKRVGPAVTLGDDDIASLKGWQKLSDKEKAGIVGVERDGDGKVSKLVYSPDLAKEDMLACTECNIQAPESFTHACPVCGIDF